MSNFSPRKFNVVRKELSGHVAKNWKVGRGRKLLHCPKDVIFMVLTVVKHGGNWDFLGNMFKIKGPTFEKLIMGYMKVIWERLY